MTITVRPGVAPRTGAGPVLDAVDRWAAQLPTATAVTAPDGVLTFSELNKTIRDFASTPAELAKKLDRLVEERL